MLAIYSASIGFHVYTSRYLLIILPIFIAHGLPSFENRNAENGMANSAIHPLSSILTADFHTASHVSSDPLGKNLASFCTPAAVTEKLYSI